MTAFIGQIILDKRGNKFESSYGIITHEEYCKKEKERIERNPARKARLIYGKNRKTIGLEVNDMVERTANGMLSSSYRKYPEENPRMQEAHRKVDAGVFSYKEAARSLGMFVSVYRGSYLRWKRRRENEIVHDRDRSS